MFKVTVSVRVFDETGFVMIQKGFDTSPLRNIKFQSIPEGKMSTNVLFTQSMQGKKDVYIYVYIIYSIEPCLAMIREQQ